MYLSSAKTKSLPGLLGGGGANCTAYYSSEMEGKHSTLFLWKNSSIDLLFEKAFSECQVFRRSIILAHKKVLHIAVFLCSESFHNVFHTIRYPLQAPRIASYLQV